MRCGLGTVREKGDDGAFRIDPAELTRFMDAARAQRATCALETAETAPVTPDGWTTAATDETPVMQPNWRLAAAARQLSLLRITWTQPPHRA